MRVLQRVRSLAAPVLLIVMFASAAAAAATPSGGDLTPGFSTNTSAGPAPLTVRFSDTSKGSDIMGRAWDFNDDGITDSTDENPDCVYNLPGNYTVHLTVSGAAGNRTISRSITVGSPASVAAFTADNVTGIAPLAVRFTDTSAGSNIYGWVWDFDNDGITDSTDQNPECVYLRTGNYSVRLTVTDPRGSYTTTRADLISVTDGIAPAFTANRTAGTAPLAVRFTDTSVGTDIMARAWDFDNDGITDSTDQNPECVYLLAGNYSASLVVTTGSGEKKTTPTGFIAVTNGAIPAFIANQTRGNIPLAVRFTDTSAGSNITGWAWDFDNDGITDSTDQNPVCVYLLPDRYSVGLTLTTAGGSNTTTIQDLILAESLAPVAGFTANSTTGIPPLAVRFTDTSVGPNITARAWDFNNDGITDSTDENPECVYNLPGSYTVTLRETNGYGSNISTRGDLVTVSDGIPVARFAVNRTGGPAPLAIRFRDISSGPGITGRAWDFNDDGIPDSTEQTGDHTYWQPGNYTVRLTVATAWGADMAVRKNFVQVT